MSLLSFLFKSKKEMSEPKTKVVRIRKYFLTSHAQNRIVDPNRHLKKTDLVDNIYRKPLAIGKAKKDVVGRLSYKRVGRYASIYVNPINNNIVSVRRTGKEDGHKYNLKKRGRKYVKKGKR